MADEVNERSIDLNLYLGLPRSPGRFMSSEDLGSDLSLGSIPMDDNFGASLGPSRTENGGTNHTHLLDILSEVFDGTNNVDTDASFARTSASLLPTTNEADEFFSVIPISNPRVEVQDNDDRGLPPPNHELLQFPEFRFRRLIESNNRSQLRRFRSSLPYSGERLRQSGGNSCSTEQLIRDIMTAPRSVRSNGKEKNVDREDSEEKGDNKIKSFPDFDCNVCLEVAKEPVVTSCGHLFCWPCLYQWLHIHSGHKECPVCKGEVSDANITPIYGRGSPGGDMADKKSEKNGDLSSLKIPPRPQGQRHESLRQQLQRPLLRRFGEGVSWRRIFDEEIHGGQTRLDGIRESNLQELIEFHYRTIARMREQRGRREDGNNINTSTPPIVGSTSSPSEDVDIWERLSLRGLGLSERLAAISADLGRVVERLGSSTEQLSGIISPNNTTTASPSSDNPQNPEQHSIRVPSASTQASDQASASSTIAVIEGDAAVAPASADPSSAGPSRPLRRIRRSRALSSLDVDGMLHERKRRRLN